MKLNLQPVLVAAVLVLAAGSNLHAQDATIPPDVKAFAAQYVAAFNSKDISRFEALQVPQSRACITPANKAVYDEILSAEMRDPVTPRYRLTLFPVNESQIKALSRDAYFPLKPEHELHIDWEYPNTQDGGGLVLWLVRQNGRWMGDFPCMTEHALKDFRDNAAARQHYKALAAQIKEPLRSQLLTMLRAHQTGEAETRYKEVTGSDMRTAVLVINALAEDVR